MAIQAICSRTVSTTPGFGTTRTSGSPVKAGLCRKPLDWPWSSHAITISGRSPNWLASRRLLSYFEGQGGDPLDLFVQLVEAFAHKPKGDSPL
jgi:hypothetical protein